MTKQEEKLFSEEPDREYDSGKTKTWQDEEIEKAKTKLHEPDKFNHRDDLGLEPVGQIGAEAGGMSHAEALRKVTAAAARNVIAETFTENERTREAAEREARRANDEEIKKLLSDPPANKAA